MAKKRRHSSRKHKRSLGNFPEDLGMYDMDGLGSLGADVGAVVRESLMGGKDLAIMGAGAVVGLSVSELMLNKVPFVNTAPWWGKALAQAAFAMACGFAAPRVTQNELRGAVIGVGTGAMVAAVLRVVNNLAPSAASDFLPRIAVGGGMSGFGDSFTTRRMLNGVVIDGNPETQHGQGFDGIGVEEISAGSAGFAGLGYALPDMDPQYSALL